MFILRVGLPRSTKTYAMVQDLYNNLKRNKKWFDKKKTKTKRKVYTNVKLAEFLEKEYSDYIEYFSDEKSFQNIVSNVKDADIYIDEVSNYFDADNYQNMPFSYKVFLNQYAKDGNTIQCTTQDASQLYKRARRKVTKIYQHHKIMGNPSPSPTRPEIKTIWGIWIAWASRFTMSADGELELTREWGLPNIGFLTREIVDCYDTTQHIEKLQYQVLGHYEYACADEGCDFKKTVHR